MKLAKETTSFTWEIKGVEEIKRMDTWEAVHCEFKVSKFTWSLSLTSNNRYLYVVPSLVEPKNVVVKFAMAIMVLNNNNQVINTPILGNTNSYIIHFNGYHIFQVSWSFYFLNAGQGGDLGYYGCASEKKLVDQKWEVLKFGETNFDYFSSQVYNGSLKLFVEMTVFYDTHGA